MGIREDSEHENELLKQACCVYTIRPQKKKKIDLTLTSEMLKIQTPPSTHSS